MNTKTAEVVDLPALQTAPAPAALVPGTMQEAMALADKLATSELVPKHLRDKPGDCLLVIGQAIRWEMDPLAVAQCTSVVHGRLMYEGKLVAAVVNGSGQMAERLNYHYSGQGQTRAVRVTGKIKGETQHREVTVTLAAAKTTNERWTKDPDQMLAYYGARAWGRRHMPEYLLGVYSPEEFEEPAFGPDHAREINPQDRPASKLDALESVTGEPDEAETEPFHETTSAPDHGPADMDDGDDFPGDRPSFAVPLGKKENGKPDYAAWLLAVADRVKAAPDTDTLQRIANANGDILSDIRNLGPKGQANHKWLNDVFDARYDELGGVKPKDADTLGAC